MSSINDILWVGKSIRNDEMESIIKAVNDYIKRKPNKKVPIMRSGPRAFAMANYCVQNDIDWELSDRPLLFDFAISHKYIDNVKKSMFGTETIAISDCFLENISISDCNIDSIGKMLKKHLNIEILSIAGMNISAFYYILYLLMEHNKSSEYNRKIVLEVTPIAFSQKRPFLPEAQHSQIFEGLRESFNDIGLGDEIDRYISVLKERENSLSSSIGIRKEYNEKTIKRDAVIFTKMYYSYEWENDSESVRYFVNLLELFKKNEIKASIILAPINHNLIKTYAGDGYLINYNKNVSKIDELVRKYGYELHNIQNLLSKDDFADDVLISETLNEFGRKKYAEYIRKLLGDS